MESGPRLTSSTGALRRLSGDAWSHFIGYLHDTSSLPPRERTFDRFLYGLAQPLIGARFLLRHSQLLKSALYPALLLGLFCATISWVGSGGSAEHFVRRFYRTFVALAPLPSIVFARHYARLAASAHQKLGFGDCGPRIEPLAIAIRRAVFQAILIVLAAAPALALLRVIPLIGRRLAWFAAGIWALYWVVIDAFDDARTLKRGETLAEAELKDRSAPPAWFVRGLYRICNHVPPGLTRLTRSFTWLCDRLSLAWREEMAVVESQPWVAIGFGLMTAALIATPLLNLLFRPIVIVASVHLLGQVNRESAAEEATFKSPAYPEAQLLKRGLPEGTDIASDTAEHEDLPSPRPALPQSQM